MPYIITTSNPTLRAAFDEAGGRGVDLAERIDAAESRTAVATLDEARNDVAEMIPDDPALDAVAEGVYDVIGESGGTVGPLPDGTVIEVRRELVTPTLAREAGIPRRNWFHMSDAAIIAAFNGAHA